MEWKRRVTEMVIQIITASVIRLNVAGSRCREPIALLIKQLTKAVLPKHWPTSCRIVPEDIPLRKHGTSNADAAAGARRVTMKWRLKRGEAYYLARPALENYHDRAIRLAAFCHEHGAGAGCTGLPQITTGSVLARINYKTGGRSWGAKFGG